MLKAVNRLLKKEGSFQLASAASKSSSKAASCSRRRSNCERCRSCDGNDLMNSAPWNKDGLAQTVSTFRRFSSACTYRPLP